MPVISVNLVGKFMNTGAVIPKGCYGSLLEPVRTLVMSVQGHKGEPSNLCTGLPVTTDKNHS